MQEWTCLPSIRRGLFKNSIIPTIYSCFSLFCGQVPPPPSSPKTSFQTFGDQTLPPPHLVDLRKWTSSRLRPPWWTVQDDNVQESMETFLSTVQEPFYPLQRNIQEFHNIRGASKNSIMTGSPLPSFPNEDPLAPWWTWHPLSQPLTNMLPVGRLWPRIFPDHDTKILFTTCARWD